MKKSVGIILFVVGLALAGFGFYQQQNNTKTLLKIGKAEIKTEKESSEVNMLLIAGSVVAIAGVGIAVLAKK